jgi:hypothetical protein
MDTAPAPQRFWQNFGGGKDDMEHVPGDQHNMYTELQTGVMPTQYAYPCLVFSFKPTIHVPFPDS